MSHPEVDPIESLRAELSRVEVSPDFAERVRRQIGEDAMASIGAELSELLVSPEFAVRVRQQIEDAPAQSRWFGMFDWRWAVPVAAAAVIGAFMLTRGIAPTTRRADSAGVQARGSAPPAAQVPQAPSMTSIAPGTPGSQSLPAAPHVNERTTASAAASGQQTDDKLEVITYQPAAYRQLWAASAAATVVQSADLPVEVRDVAVTPVEVVPVVVQWLVEPPVSGGGAVPNVRRVSAAAERSDK